VATRRRECIANPVGVAIVVAAEFENNNDGTECIHCDLATMRHNTSEWVFLSGHSFE
jgi:hypothetical protein